MTSTLGPTELEKEKGRSGDRAGAAMINEPSLNPNRLRLQLSYLAFFALLLRHGSKLYYKNKVRCTCFLCHLKFKVLSFQYNIAEFLCFIFYSLDWQLRTLVHAKVNGLFRADIFIMFIFKLKPLFNFIWTCFHDRAVTAAPHAEISESLCYLFEDTLHFSPEDVWISIYNVHAWYLDYYTVMGWINFIFGPLESKLMVTSISWQSPWSIFLLMSCCFALFQRYNTH